MDMMQDGDRYGRILQSDLAGRRDQLVISTKAGYDMWPGPYGEWGSRKYLLASLEQSLRRLRLEYVDIFYSHRFDPETPLLIHQPSYSMLNRWIEDALLDVLGEEGVGCIAFSPLAQGMLTDKYLHGIPEDSRVRTSDTLSESMLTDQALAKVRGLDEIAGRRGQSLA